MASTVFPPPAGGLSRFAGSRRGSTTFLRAAMEAGVLILVCLSPWAFGGAAPEFELVLYIGLAVLVSFWAARMLFQRRLSWNACPVALCLAGLVVLAVWQLVPLPQSWLKTLSPATAHWYERLLPSQAEILPFGANTPVASSGSTLSVYPGRTRQELIRLLAVLLLFGVVRNNTASSSSLRRFSIIVFINGACLSLFALLQFFTSRDHTVYWSLPVSGSGFGPFINRNHFAFYMNLCVGLGVGLLFSRAPAADFDDRALAPVHFQDSVARLLSPFRGLLQDSAVLWIIGGLALMVSSVIFSVSRGGILALVSACLIFLFMSSLRSVRFRRMGAVLLIASLAVTLVAWFGVERVQARLSTLWGNEVAKEGRLHLWSRVLPLVKDFPIWGTGYGTFQQVEPLVRRDPADETFYTNAENDYLEVLLEGGLVRLVLSVSAIGLVFLLGSRALRGGAGRGSVALAVGLLFAFSTMVIQSFFDFALHIPAVALLATVVSAHLCAAGTSRNPAVAHRAHDSNNRAASRLLSRRLWGLAAVAGAFGSILLGLLISYEGWRAYQAARLSGALPTSGSEQIDRLLAAAHMVPESARLQVELGRVYYDGYEQQRKKLWIRGMLLDAVQAVSDVSPMRAPAWTLSSEARNQLSKGDERHLVREGLVPALRCFLEARDSCPLLAEPQRFLADNADEFKQADTRLTYLERVAFVTPSDPGVWYAWGHELFEKQPAEAYEKWRRSLELSDIFLPSILEVSSGRLSPREIRDQILPDDPKILVAAALQLYPRPTGERRLFLDKAVALLEHQSTPLKGKDLRAQALIQSALGRSEEALAIYQAALAYEPRQVTWRFEFAQLLFQQKRLQEARDELLNVLSAQPEYTGARDLLGFVERQLAERK